MLKQRTGRMGVLFLVLTICLRLALASGKGNLIISDCLAEEDKSFKLKCTGRLQEDNSFMSWTKSDGTTSDLISSCPSLQHKCHDWHPGNFTALTFRNESHFETELIFHTVSRDWRQTEFKCTQYKKESQVTQETQSCTLKTYHSPESPKCTLQKKGEMELFILCETPRVYPQLICRLHISFTDSHNDSDRLTDTVNMATKHHIYHNGARYFESSCSYLLRKLPTNNVELKVEMYPDVENERMEKYATFLNINAAIIETDDWSLKIFLYALWTFLALFLTMAVIFAVIVLSRRHNMSFSCFNFTIFHRYSQAVDQALPPSLEYPTINELQAANTGLNRRPSQELQDPQGTVDLYTVPPTYHVRRHDRNCQRTASNNELYVNSSEREATTASETCSSVVTTSTETSSSMHDHQASIPLLVENPGYKFDTTTIANQAEDHSMTISYV